VNARLVWFAVALGALVSAVPTCGGRSSLRVVARLEPVDRTLVEACATLMACGGPSPGPLVFVTEYAGVSECIWENLWHPEALITGFFQLTASECFAAADDCAAVERCVFGPHPVDCTSMPDQAFCDGSYRVVCLAGAAQAQDCATVGAFRDPGAACVPVTGTEVTCSFGACTPDATPPCDGNTTLRCEDGELTRWTCPWGSSCVAGEHGGTCQSEPGACTSDRCVGGDILSCFEGHYLRIPCTELPIPSSCVLAPDGETDCAPLPSLPCDPRTHLDYCDGSELVYCDGQRRAFDCQAHGFRTCDAAHGWAACAW
jgi:hypothetical protein